MLQHPAHAALDCSECKQWIYDIETATPKLRRGKKQPRPAGVPTPCQSCPKQSPERWETLKLNRRSLATLALYRRTRATYGRALNDAEARDELLQANFALLDAIFTAWERAASQRAIYDAMTTARRATNG